MPVRAVALLVILLALWLPGTTRADSVTLSFSGGVVNASSSLPYLTNNPADGGTPATLNVIVRTPNPPGPAFGGPSADLGSVTFTTGNGFVGTPTSVLFLPGGSVSIVSNATFESLTGVLAGTTLFSGTFTGVTTWTQLTCVGAPLSCGPIDYTLSGPVGGSFDPGFLAFLNLGATPPGGFAWNLSMSFSNGLATTGTVGSGTAAPVPEPGSMLLLGSGLAGVAARVRRRTRRQQPTFHR